MIAFRNATPADAAAVARIHVTAWRHSYAGLIHQPVLDALAGEGTDGDVRHTMVVAERDGEVVGWATYGPARRPERDRWGELAGSYVDPLAARSGVGRAMIAEVESRLADAGFARAYLWVLEGNEPAEQAYSRYGWEPDGATLPDPDTDPARTLVALIVCGGPFWEQGLDVCILDGGDVSERPKVQLSKSCVE